MKGKKSSGRDASGTPGSPVTNGALDLRGCIARGARICYNRYMLSQLNFVSEESITPIPKG